MRLAIETRELGCGFEGEPWLVIEPGGPDEDLALRTFLRRHADALVVENGPGLGDVRLRLRDSVPL